MRNSSVMCDRCGKVKGEANHWLKGAQMCGGYLLADAEAFDPPTEKLSERLVIEDFCSDQCALAQLAGHLRTVI